MFVGFSGVLSLALTMTMVSAWFHMYQQLKINSELNTNPLDLEERHSRCNLNGFDGVIDY